MAQPLLLFENLFELGTLTARDTTAGFPVSNVLDWQQHTAARWKGSATTDLSWVQVDLGVGVTADPDVTVVAGHNAAELATGGTALFRPQWSDDGAAWTDAAATMTGTDDLPRIARHSTPKVAHRWWRVRIDKGAAGTFTVVPQIGIVTTGRFIQLPGLEAEFDPYGLAAEIEQTRNDRGVPIGANRAHTIRRFRMSYTEAGLAVADFFRPATGLGVDSNFIPHAIDAGKRFWLAWDTTLAPTAVWLCRVVDNAVRMPWVGTTARRAFDLEIEAYQEAA